MEIKHIGGQPFLSMDVPNITQPDLTVALLVRTHEDPRTLEKMQKLTHYMAEQSKMLIPYFYELRNELPRGRVQQMMARRARSLGNAEAAAIYRELVSCEDFDYSVDLPLRTIKVEGNQVRVSFSCDHDPDFALFEKTMEIPFHKPEMWADIEAYEKIRLAEEALALEKKAGKDDLDDDAVNDADASADADLYDMAC